MHVPGWHEATRTLQEEGALQMVGIVQEQHPDRARLFLQWKRMEWPILVDSLGLLDVPYVPITLALDEHGVIREIGLPMADPEGQVRRFLEIDFAPPEGTPRAKAMDVGTSPVRDPGMLRPARGRETAEAWSAYADALGTWSGEAELDAAIDAYGRALALAPGDGALHFRLGVVYRKRYDSARRKPGDFQKAIDKWSRALSIDPNNYIWRRRIQQYGPRLDKPYPFYDWVVVAREEIRARGESPVRLTAEPGGAEFAGRVARFPAAAGLDEEPDPQGKITRDPGRFIVVETTVVPPTNAPGSGARVHLVMRPNDDIRAHWNNEVADAVVWVTPPAGWQVDSRRLSIPNPSTAVSREPRTVEFELKRTSPKAGGTVSVPAYALYYVCEDVRGTCLYRRQDLNLEIGERADTG